MTRKLTKTARIARQKAFYNFSVEGPLFGEFLAEEVRAKVPRAWHTIERDIDVEEPKEKVTLYLDRSVAQCFRAMGKGWQGRVNWLLRTWLHMKTGELLELEKFAHEMAVEALTAERDVVAGKKKPASDEN